MEADGRPMSTGTATNARTKPYPAPWLAWSVWSIGAVFYLAVFFLRAAPAVMTTELMRDFHIGAASLGQPFGLLLLLLRGDADSGRRPDQFLGRAEAAGMRRGYGRVRSVPVRRDGSFRPRLHRPRDHRRLHGGRMAGGLAAGRPLVSQPPVRYGFRAWACCSEIWARSSHRCRSVWRWSISDGVGRRWGRRP